MKENLKKPISQQRMLKNKNSTLNLQADFTSMPKKVCAVKHLRFSREKIVNRNEKWK